MKEYLIRASLEYRDSGQESNSGQPRHPNNLPVTIGPFQLDQSPNFQFYLADRYFVESDGILQSNPNWNYPVSFLYVESTATNPEQ